MLVIEPVPTFTTTSLRLPLRLAESVQTLLDQPHRDAGSVGARTSGVQLDREVQFSHFAFGVLASGGRQQQLADLLDHPADDALDDAVRGVDADRINVRTGLGQLLRIVVRFGVVEFQLAQFLDGVGRRPRALILFTALFGRRLPARGGGTLAPSLRLVGSLLRLGLGLGIGRD